MQAGDRLLPATKPIAGRRVALLQKTLADTALNRLSYTLPLSTSEQQ